MTQVQSFTYSRVGHDEPTKIFTNRRLVSNSDMGPRDSVVVDLLFNVLLIVCGSSVFVFMHYFVSNQVLQSS